MRTECTQRYGQQSHHRSDAGGKELRNHLGFLWVLLFAIS